MWTVSAHAQHGGTLCHRSRQRNGSGRAQHESASASPAKAGRVKRRLRTRSPDDPTRLCQSASAGASNARSGAPWCCTCTRAAALTAWSVFNKSLMDCESCSMSGRTSSNGLGPVRHAAMSACPPSAPAAPEPAPVSPSVDAPLAKRLLTADTRTARAYLGRCCARRAVRGVCRCCTTPAKHGSSSSSTELAKRTARSLPIPARSCPKTWPIGTHSASVKSGLFGLCRWPAAAPTRSEAWAAWARQSATRSRRSRSAGMRAASSSGATPPSPRSSTRRTSCSSTGAAR